MKKILALAMLVTCAVGFVAFKKVEQKLNDVFDLLGIPKTEATEVMRDNLLYASLEVPFSRKKYQSTAPSQRAAIVQELGAYMKTYFNSTEIATAYAEYRESMMPGRQEGIDVKERIAEIKRNIRQTENDKKSAPADMKKAYDEALELMRKELAVLQNPAHPDYKMYTGAIELTQEQQEEINRQLKEFNKEYPTSVQQYLKLKLQAFLELSADVDFNAKLVRKDGKLKFENPVYEAKDKNWKRCFRAGKETIEAARAFAQQWLKEIP